MYACPYTYIHSHLHRHESELRHTPPYTSAHTFPLLSPWCVCVLFMCFYVFPLVISWAFCSAGTLGDGKRRQTWFDVVEFFCHRRMRKRKRSLKKNPESEMQNVIASSIKFKRTLSSQCFSLSCFIHGELLGLLSFTQLQ